MVFLAGAGLQCGTVPPGWQVQTRITPKKDHCGGCGLLQTKGPESLQMTR